MDIKKESLVIFDGAHHNPGEGGGLNDHFLFLLPFDLEASKMSKTL